MAHTNIVPIGPIGGRFHELHTEAPPTFAPARTSGHIDLPLDGPRAEPVYQRPTPPASTVRRENWTPPHPLPGSPAPIDFDAAVREGIQRQAELYEEEQADVQRLMAERIRMSEVAKAARQEGRDAGHRRGFVEGTRWGMFVGLVAGTTAAGIVTAITVLVRSHVL